MKKYNKNKDIQNYLFALRLSEEICDIARGDKITLEEGDAVSSFANETLHGTLFFNNITNQEHFKREYDGILKERSLKITRVESLINKAQKSRNRKRITRIIYASTTVAALVIFYFGVSMYETDIEREIAAHQTHLLNSINHPTLILESGEHIDLSSVTAKSIINTNAITEEDGKLRYNVPVKKDSVKIEYNKLLIPSKSRYSVVLSDGSEVLLNASTEFRYPNIFVGKVREVEINGEGFFNVAKSDIPFVVKVGDVRVKVYGTQFNITTNKYDGMQTTLVEGSVGVTVNGHETIIKPNQMLAVTNGGDSVAVVDVDATRMLGWMTDYFYCESETLANLLQEVESWYGVKFIYKDENIKTIRLGLSVKRSRKIEELLDAIEDMANVKFVREGGNVYTVEMK